MEEPTFDPSRRVTEEADYEDTVRLLNQLQRGYSLRMNGNQQRISAKERTGKWLDLLGCNVKNLRKPSVIHVAGTKGKGSTCYYCNHILNGYQRMTGEHIKIGCYTSPHQVDVRERIQINNGKISKPMFSHYVRKLYNEIQSLTLQPGLETPPVPGYPGFLALLAIYIFILEEIDVAILETGIGGERDSTNVFPNPVATGITTIGLDHVKTLGNSIEKIAEHKAGIFKPGSLAFAVAQEEAVLRVLRKRAEEVHVAGELQVITDQAVCEYALKVNPDMPYQRLNASLAISLAGAYLKSVYPCFVMTKDIARGLEQAQLPGRSEIRADKYNTWFISVAHNELSLKQTVLWFKETVQRSEHARAPKVMIFNSPSRMDADSLLRVVHESLNAYIPVTLRGVIFCTDQSDETGKEKLDLIDLREDREAISSLRCQKGNAEIWKRLDDCANIAVVHTIREAIGLVREDYEGARVLVTGSHYLASGALHILQSGQSCD